MQVRTLPTAQLNSLLEDKQMGTLLLDHYSGCVYCRDVVKDVNIWAYNVEVLA